MTDTIQQLDFSVNLLKSLLWQHNNAANLQSLIEGKNDWYVVEQQGFWDNWIRDVFDLRTANQFGLEVWSIILQIPLFVNTKPSDPGTLYFGFGSDNGNFGQSNFGSLTGTSSLLSIESKRIALRLRYFSLVTSGTVPEINRFLAHLFGEDQAFLADHQNMTQTYVFLFPLSAELRYIFDNFDVLPRPAGVKSGYTDATIKSFGFSSKNANFNRGSFGG